MNKIVLTLAIFVSLSHFIKAQGALTCNGSKTGAKITLLSTNNEEIKVKVDWDEGATFTPQNLQLTNATCVNCPYVGGIGKNNPVQTWTLKQTDLAKPVSVAWATEGTIKFCGNGSLSLTSKNTLLPGENLNTGQRLYSADGQYFLFMQEDGNLCIYKTENNGFVWCSMAHGFNGGVLKMQEDGNLVVYEGSTAKWSTKTHPFYDKKYANAANKPVKAVLENAGTLVVYAANGQAMWSSNM